MTIYPTCRLCGAVHNGNITCPECRSANRKMRKRRAQAKEPT
jgi:ssDNA-binding Zn-finger/Zn-ribbon topoisomerase 1